MRWFGLFAMVAALVGPQAQAGAGPTLRAERLTPLTLVGRDFVTLERVRVTLVVGRSAPKRRVTRADADGSFRVRFGLVALETCDGVVRATAVGSRGSAAAFRRACRPRHEEPA